MAEMASTVKTPEEMLVRLQSLVESAVQEGGPASCDAELCARVVWVTYNGSLVTWAIHRRGSIGDWVRENLESVLGPLRR